MWIARPDVKRALDALLEATEEGEVIALDRVADALGDVTVGTAEVEAVLDALERAGRVVSAPEGGGASGGESSLAAVVTAARVLRAELGRAPTRAEVAARAGISDSQVAVALLLVRVMQR
jgi:predicted aconitase with swiveling domain